MFTQYLPLIHLLTTIWMTAVIWFVQLVFYPSLAQWRRSSFGLPKKRSTSLTGLVVGPAMLAEMGSFCLLLLWQDSFHPYPLLALSGIPLGIAWLSTILFQVPCHRQLESEFHSEAIRRLVTTNWIRTICWTLRSLLLLMAWGGKSL